MNTNRCEWCGRWVGAGTSAVAWRARGADGQWREFSRLLCRPCADSVMSETEWRKPMP